MNESKLKFMVPSLTGLNKYIHFAFFVGFFLFFYVFANLVESIWNVFANQNDIAVIIISVILSAGVILYFWVNPTINSLASEVANELSKVSWPTKKETYAFTVTVIVTSVIAAIILGIFDLIWAWATGLIYS